MPAGAARAAVNAMYTPAAASPAPSPEHETPAQLFLSLSATLTGFNAAEIQGTGLLQTYFTLIPSIVGEQVFGDFLTRWRDTWIRGKGDEALLDELVTSQIFEDDTFGPLARNLAALWYLGQWNQLPAEWRNVHGAWANDVTFIVSPQSYTEALVWKAIHTHPPAAKQPGYGSWALPPETETPQ
jgi:hypothetical protein